MKRVGKILDISCGLLLLAGCGNNDTASNKQLVCTIENANGKAKFTINFNDDRTNIEDIKFYNQKAIPEGELETYQAKIVDYCNNPDAVIFDNLDDCEAKIEEDNMITQGNIPKNEITEMFMNKSSYDEVLEHFQDIGYRCN